MIGWRERRDRKVVAVFASNSQEAATVVAHVLKGSVTLPIFLYCRQPPSAGTAARCARVTIESNSLDLIKLARAQLSSYWVALGVASWNRKRDHWSLKLAPFFFPPFRVLIMNENEDFFPGLPPGIFKHLVKPIGSSLRTAGSWIVGAIRFLYSMALAYAAKWDPPGPFEVIAKHSSFLSRFVFSLFRHSELLAVSAKRSRESGVQVIELCKGEWWREDVLHLLASSNSRWVVFQESTDPTAEPWEDMLPLLNEHKTFAVSRQTAYQGWLKSVLPSAAFRKLQPDEAAQVLAPISRQVVFDRAKLMALGIPNLRSSAASFYLLFWKAAAAGWRSYSIGSREEVGQLAAMPAAEAQFVQALLRNPFLARLQPQEAALVRGSVSHSCVAENSFRGLPRILIVSPFLPFPLSHGGAVRIYNLCRSLSDQFDLVLTSFREKDDVTDYGKLNEIFREVYVVSMDEVNKHLEWPDAVSGYESSAMRALIPRICAEWRIEIVQLEYTQMAAYRESVPYLPAILVEHDITFSLYRQIAERDKTPAAERAYQAWLRFETDRLQAFDVVWTMSEADKYLAVKEGASEDQVSVVPNGVDIHKFHGAPEPNGSCEILYIGSFRHLPNYLAFRELCDSIMPMVWRDQPNATLRVVAGPNHEAYWHGSRNLDPRITVHGFVADVAPLYERCVLTVAPLPVSAGTNIKVMEAMASERAIVSTPVGCAGLGLRHGVDAMICDLGPGFADAICHLLGNPRMRRSLARQGRLTAEQRFSWDSIKELAADSYYKLLNAESELWSDEQVTRQRFISS
jgi:glycosyltransferase involved in cell wall biosynthesis